MTREDTVPEVEPALVRSWTPAPVITLGVLVMVVGGVVAGKFMPSWSARADSCTFAGVCGGAAPERTLALLWWVEGIGFAVVLAGLAMAWRSRPAAAPEPVRSRVPPAARAAAAGAAGAAVFAVAGLFVLFAVLSSPQLGAAVLCVLWLLQIGVLAGTGRSLGSPLPAARRLGPDALVGLVAIAVAALLAFEEARRGGASIADGWLVVLVDGVCLVLGTLIAHGDRTHRLAGLALAVIGVGTVAVLTISAESYRPPPPFVPSPMPPTVAAAPSSLAPPSFAPPPVDPPAPEPTIAPVKASVACTTDTLTWGTSGWDAALGARSVAVVATNSGSRPCYVDGYADVHVSRGGVPLQLVLQQGDPDDPALGGGPRRVGIAPGGTASFTLAWRGYIGHTDPVTQESLQVALPAGTGWADVPLGVTPAPFDLVDGGRIKIGSWAPALS